MDSILNSVKKALGIESDYTYFDPDITLHINSVLLSLTQIGVGPSSGFVITSDEETWVDFIDTRTDLEAIKTLIYLKVRLIFDPPTLSFVIDSIERTIKELEWRLNVQTERSE